MMDKLSLAFDDPAMNALARPATCFETKLCSRLRSSNVSA
jgi:hypothetical protein